MRSIAGTDVVQVKGTHKLGGEHRGFRDPLFSANVAAPCFVRLRRRCGRVILSALLLFGQSDDPHQMPLRSMPGGHRDKYAMDMRTQGMQKRERRRVPIHIQM